jgi:glycosyltransferase involved in cell wall biosynthesis
VETIALTPRVSIVVDNYNYARFLPRSIESALSQTWPGTEVVVVDDASTDGSQEIIRGYGDRVAAILQEKNQGQGAAFNAGAAASHGDIVIFLDSDDYLFPNAVEAVVAAWRPGLAKLQFRLDLVDAEDRVIGLMPAREVRFDDGNVVPRLLEAGCYQTTVTSGNAFARQALERVLPMPAEDFRISADGYLVTTVPFHGEVGSVEESLGAYRLHGTNAWAVAGPDLAARLRASLDHDEKRYGLICAQAKACGLVAAGDFGQRDVHHLTSRLGSLVLEPSKHPHRGDRRPALALDGARAVRKSPLPTVWKIFLATWFLAAGILPRPLARRAVQWRLDSASRPPTIARLLRRARRSAQPSREVENR